jgi:hypothetical protein
MAWYDLNTATDFATRMTENLNKATTVFFSLLRLD